MQRARYVAVNVFLVVHILAIGCWCLPFNSPLIRLCRDLAQPYLFWAGLFQSWDMFAPNPKAANTYIEAILVYGDGSRGSWQFPRMELLTLHERYCKERYRKFAESLLLDDNDGLLPDVARYVARLNSGRRKVVKTVILLEKWSLNVPQADGKNAPAPWQQHVLLGYGVTAGDLQ